ncbi:phage major capsid protein [Amycolatopsis sp. lyj-112]|uniref:phage major capsid protein n=1 Tax=Amycolatopsis sp. lyj-112 TaxID=2789288 RepID=UPI00397D6F0B
MKTNKERLQDALKAHEDLVSKFNDLAGQEVTEEVRSELDELDTKIEARAAEIDQLEARVASEAKVAETRSRYAHIVDAAPQKREEGKFGEELRSAILEGKPFDVTGGPVVSNMAEYRAAPVKAAGGNYTNDDFVTAVMTAFAENTAVFRAGARIVTTSSGEPITAPVVANIGGALTAEAAALPETTDNTAKTLTAYKYGAIADLSRELVEDTSVDVVSLVAGLVGDNVSGAVNAHFIAGTGSSQPQGLIVGAGAGATAAGVSAITEADLFALYYSVKDSARNKGAWFMHPTTAAALRSLEGLWTINPAADNPEQLLGRPVFTDSSMETPGANKRSIVFGDPKAYFVRSVRGLRVERSDDYKFGNDLVAVKVVWRGDGVVTDPNAIKKLTHPAS